MIFIQEFLKHPLQVSSIIPSSRYLERRIVDVADIVSAELVVELGAGTGGITRAILRELPPHARLLCIEINPHFHTLLENINDDRLITHLGSAHELEAILALYNLGAPDTVISGIPFSTMSPDIGSGIIKAVDSQLPPDGRFIAYQVSKRVATLCQPVMGKAKINVECLNFPPMRIFQWQKQSN